MSTRPKLIYLDSLATTPVDPQVVAAMEPYWFECFGNPASISHVSGIRAKRVVEEARARMAHSLNCHPEELIWTSGATEANNLALKGWFATSSTGTLITQPTEHKSVLDPARRLKRQGIDLHLLPVDNLGRVLTATLNAVVSHPLRLVSVMWANNELGTVQDIAALSEQCHSLNFPLHVDATQAVGKVRVDLSKVPIDMLSCTAHKLHGPPGIGLLFVRRQNRRHLQPLLEGGGHQGGLRSGTLPVPLIVGFAKAMELACQHQAEERVRQKALIDQLWNGLTAAIPGLKRNSPVEGCLSHVLNVYVPGVDGEALLARLRTTCLCVSSGSACTSANPEPSYVLRAVGLSDGQARSSLRFGVHRFTTTAEILEAVDLVAACERSLRNA